MDGAPFQLRESGFSVNAEIGLQSVLVGAKIKEVPVSWINRTFDMGTSSFSLTKFGGGYFRVLGGLFLKRVFGAGVYKNLPIRKLADTKV